MTITYIENLIKETESLIRTVSFNILKNIEYRDSLNNSINELKEQLIDEWLIDACKKENKK